MTAVYNDPYVDLASLRRQHEAEKKRGGSHEAVVAPFLRQLTVAEMEACGPWGPFPEREQVGWQTWCSSCGDSTSTRYWPLEREQTARAWRCPRARRSRP